MGGVRSVGGGNGEGETRRETYKKINRGERRRAMDQKYKERKQESPREK